MGFFSRMLVPRSDRQVPKPLTMLTSGAHRRAVSSSPLVNRWLAAAAVVCLLASGCSAQDSKEASPAPSVGTFHPPRAAPRPHRDPATHHQAKQAKRKDHKHHRSGHARGHGLGVPPVDLPRPGLTPGDVLSYRAATVCRSGYASSVRNVPSSEKETVYVRYHDRHVPYAYEVDHLVSLELGGSNAITNLWPEPYTGRWNARAKDALENRLHRLVCAGSMTLRYAQFLEIRNWVGAYRTYIGGMPSPGRITRTTKPLRRSSPALGNGCEPGYSPCLPRVRDLNCADIPSGKRPVRVTGSDPYRLDANHDGYGCTS